MAQNITFYPIYAGESSILHDSTVACRDYAHIHTEVLSIAVKRVQWSLSYRSYNEFRYEEAGGDHSTGVVANESTQLNFTGYLKGDDSGVAIDGRSFRFKLIAFMKR